MRRKINEDNQPKAISKIADIFFIVVAFAFVMSNCIFGAYVVKFDVLPTIYLVTVLIILSIFSILAMIILISKKCSVILKMLIAVLVIGLSSAYIYGISYIKATMTFMDTMTTEITETEEYYIVTLSDSKYISLELLEGNIIYTFMADEDYTDIKDGILSKITVDFKDDSNIKKLAEMLLDSRISAVLISKSQYDMLAEEYESFIYKTQKLYTVTHKIKKVEEESKEETSLKEDDTILNGTFNIYVSGIDTSGKISNVARSDANILVTVNTKTHNILVTSIPRDYYVTLHSKGIKDKLTHSGIYGIKETYSSVEDLLGIDIQYYLRVNFTSLEKIVDALGGVNVYSEYAFSTVNYNFKKGYNYLDGKMALAFSRERLSFASGDRQRIKNQQEVIESIINKVLTSETILTKYTALLQSLSNSFQTNISTEEISHIIKGQLNNMTGWSIQMQALDGTGAYMPTYSYGSELLYVMLPDDKSVSESIVKIKGVLESK